MIHFRGRSGRSRDHEYLERLEVLRQLSRRKSAYSILSRISCSQLESLSQVQKISHKLSSWWGEPCAASPSYINDQQRTCPSATLPFPHFQMKRETIR